MDEQELMMKILDKVSSIKLYYSDIDGVYVSEFFNIGRSKFSHESGETYQDLLENTYRAVECEFR